MNKKKQIEALNGKNADYIVNAGSRILGNPIAMYDTSYTLLAYAEGIVTDDPFWNELVQTGTFSHKSVDFFGREGFIQAYAESEWVAFMKSPHLKYDRMNGKLFDIDGVQLGNIIVVACENKFEDGDTELIELLCEILSNALQNSELYHKIDRVYGESLINRMIEDGLPRPPAQIARLYEGLKENLYLAVIEVSEYERTISHLAYFRDLFKKLQPEFRYFIHLNNVIALVGTDAPFLSMKDLQKLNDFFNNYKIYAGISGKFQDLGELKKRYGEALAALNFGIKGTVGKKIFRFDNYRAEYLLNDIEPGGIIHETARRLLDSDKENDTRLSDILYAYLNCGASVAQAASALNLGTNEFNSLLKNLSGDFEIDLFDGNELVNLFLALKVLKNAEN